MNDEAPWSGARLGRSSDWIRAGSAILPLCCKEQNNEHLSVASTSLTAFYYPAVFL